MIKTISKIGNSQGIIFDSAVMELAHLSPGQEMNLEIHSGGTITLTPVRKALSRDDITKTIKSVMKDYAETMRRLA